MKTKPSAMKKKSSSSTANGKAASNMQPGPMEQEPIQASASPNLMLPMRLEYRVVKKAEMLDFAVPYSRLTDAQRQKNQSSLSFQSKKAPSTRIYFRWYPDAPFCYSGIARPSENELTALSAFNAAVPAGKHWSDTGDAAVADAWRNFVAAVGGNAARALYLKRSGGVTDAAAYKRAYQIAALPKQVALYAMKNGVRTELLTQKVTASHLTMGPSDLKEDGWMVDFAEAKAQGMAAELTDASLVSTALDADWIIAIGVNGKADASVLNTLFQDWIANGESEIVPQDATTNNSENGLVTLAATQADAVSSIASSTYAEQWSRSGVSGDSSDAAALATALGTDAQTCRQLAAAAATGHQNASDMARAVLPALLEAYFVSDPDYSLDEMVEYLATYAFARGPLPVLRLGGNPYGILPILRGTDVQISADNTKLTNTINLMHAVGKASVEAHTSLADGQPVITPDDSDATAKLEALLKQAAVSLRCDVSDYGMGDLYAVNCQYVESDDYNPSSYLVDIATKSLSSLDEPKQSDTSLPLLYRLAYISMDVMDTARVTAKFPFSKTTLPGKIVTSTSATAAALKRLAKLSTTELEVLLMEVLDLLTYRADALLTATAYYRLMRQRDAGNSGLHLSYYGMLGKLRATSTAQSQGYIHAPSLQQAASAALLKSASLRHASEEAFQIDLSSSRTRQAIDLMDLINQGFTLAEALGYKAERWLHDQAEDELIYLLRGAYPLDAGEGGEGRPLIDGYSFQKDAGASATGLSAAQRSVVSSLYAVVTDIIDSFSDLATAEAVHAMAIGDYGLGQAWTQVLSGGAIPSSLNFSTITRAGSASSYRCSLLCPAMDSTEGATAREMAEPSLAAQASLFLGSISGKILDCNVMPALEGYSGLFPGERYRLDLNSDLGMTALDIVIGGEAEIKRRAAYAVYHRIASDYPDIAAALAVASPTQSLYRGFATALKIQISGGSITALLEKAAALRAVFSSMRMLEPSDLYVDPANISAMSDDDWLSYFAYANTQLAGRVSQLSATIDGVVSALELNLGTLSGAAQAGSIGSSDIESFYDILEEASRYGLPQALTLFYSAGFVQSLEDGTTKLNDDIRGFAEGIANALSAKSTLCQSALEGWEAAVDKDTSAAARTLLVSAIQSCLDGTAMPVMPPLELDPAMLGATATTTAAAQQLPDWAGVRPKIKKLATLLNAHYDCALYTSRKLARLGYVPVLVTADGLALDSAAVICGGVIDEWSLLRPDETQMTGVAIHYDAPQCEAPNAMLLAVAEKDSVTSWTMKDLAKTVYEAIKLMKFRAIPAREASYKNAGIYLTPIVTVDSEGDQRVPNRRYMNLALNITGQLGIQVVGQVSADALTALNINERSRGKA